MLPLLQMRHTPAAAARLLGAGSSAASAAFTSMGSPSAVPVPCICSVPTCAEQPEVNGLSWSQHVTPEYRQEAEVQAMLHSHCSGAVAQVDSMASQTGKESDLATPNQNNTDATSE